MIIYNETAAFLRDFKKLLRRFSTLTDDLQVAKVNAIELYHLRKIDNHGVFSIPGSSKNENEVKIFKLKKFSCKALKGRGVHSGIRIIYAYHEKLNKIDLIEIYFKGDKEHENAGRIKEYLETLE